MLTCLLTSLCWSFDIFDAKIEHMMNTGCKHDFNHDLEHDEPRACKSGLRFNSTKLGDNADVINVVVRNGVQQTK